MRLYNGDCLDVMRGLDGEVADLTVTSPPYDDLRSYHGGVSQWNFDKFKGIAGELYRLTKPGGVVVWIVNDGTENGSETCTSFRQALYFRELGFSLYDTMIWEKPSPAAPTEGRYYDVFEYMFVFSKGRPKTLNLICDHVNSSFGSVSRKETRSCREDRKTTDGIRTVKEYSRRFNVWNVARGRNTSSHPAVFPLKLATDHVLSWSNPGDTVLEPFMGSGTTGIACVDTERDFIGIELDPEFYREAEARIADRQSSHTRLLF